jgi:hypothetical protein
VQSSQRLIWDPSSHERPEDYQRPLRARIRAESRHNSGASTREIARIVGCHYSTVSVVRRGGTWSKRKKAKAFWLGGWR